MNSPVFLQVKFQKSVFQKFAPVLFFLLIFTLFLAASSFILQKIENARIRDELVDTTLYDQLTPEEFAGTVVLAGFRVIAADLLWMRAIELWREKNWYEAMAVYRFISRLQPHAEMAWANNAWNMIVNVAVDKRQQEKPDEAFDWVQQGIDHMNEALQRNPKSAYLYHYRGLLIERILNDADYVQRFQEMGVDISALLAESTKRAAQFAPKNYLHRYRYAMSLLKELDRESLARVPLTQQQALQQRYETIQTEMHAALQHLPKNMQEGTVDYTNFVNFKQQLTEQLEKIDSQLAALLNTEKTSQTTNLSAQGTR